MLTIERAALDLLAALLLERAGLKIAPDGYHGLKLALQSRMPALGISDASEYVRRLRERQGEAELRALLPLVTVGHTEFFRDGRQFTALEKRLLPEGLAAARREGRKLSLWSAGCATGEEPYSLAMALAELGAAPSEVDLLATDVNMAAVESARVGQFPLRRVGALAPARLKRFFDPSGEGYVATAAVKAFIRFEGLNLAAPVFHRIGQKSLDIILCRNVIIYFDLPTIRGLMDRFFDALRPGGHLLLGYSESLFKVYDRFEMVEVEGSFLYRRPPRDRPVPAPVPPPRKEPADPRWPSVEELRRQRASSRGKTEELPAVRLPVTTPKPEDRSPTVEIPTVAPAAPSTRKTEEIPAVETPAQTPAAPAPAPAPTPARKQGRSPTDLLADAAARIERGEFDAALRDLQALHAREPGDLAVTLTLGNLQGLLGRPQEARRHFLEALAQEPLCVEARLYSAMTELQANRPESARDELGKAIFLEPTLALTHYLHGQILEQLGDHEGARRAYRNAVAQLRFPQRPLAGYYPDIPASAELVGRAAEYALDALDAAARRRSP